MASTIPTIYIIEALGRELSQDTAWGKPRLVALRKIWGKVYYRFERTEGAYGQKQVIRGFLAYDEDSYQVLEGHLGKELDIEFRTEDNIKHEWS